MLCNEAAAVVQVRNVEGNTDKQIVDPRGHPLPPCIVMERGKSLDIWVARAKPDRSQPFSVCSTPFPMHAICEP